jgi:uncharacterized glyoxalase superfamily protein PhnB
MTKPTVFHSLTFDDAPAMMRWLEAVGFQKVAVYSNEADPDVVEHAEYRWGDNGGIMFGSRREDSPFAREIGHGKCYLVVGAAADVDDVFARAITGGGSMIQEPVDVEYGGRTAGFRDPEGNVWSVGTYPGAA